MDKEEVIGKIALLEFERKDKLRTKITDPAYRYYFRGIRRTIGSILFILLSIGLLCLSIGSRDASSPFIVLSLILFVAFSEIIRQRERFNALVELIEMEKEENIKCEQTASGNGVTAVPEP